MRMQSMDKHIARMLLVGTVDGSRGSGRDALSRVEIDEAMIIREDAEDGKSFRLTFERESMGVIVRVIGSASTAQFYTDERPQWHTSVRVELDLRGGKCGRWDDDSRIDYHESMLSCYVHESVAFDTVLSNMHTALEREQGRWANDAGHWLTRSARKAFAEDA